MIVEVDMDRMGCVVIRPLSDRMSRRFKGKTIFLQDPSDFLEGLPKEKVKSIESGYTERIRMDEEEYAMRIGEEEF